MVPVESTAQLLIHDTERFLARRLTDLHSSEVLQLFSHWLWFHPVNPKIATLLQGASERDGALQDFRTVATLSFGQACGQLNDGQTTRLREGIDRLLGRSAFVDGIPMGFCSDVVSILGLTLAVETLNDAALTERLVGWLRSFLPRIFSMDGTDQGQRGILSAIDRLLNHSLDLPEVDPHSCPDVFVALAKRQIFDSSDFDPDGIQLTLAQSAMKIDSSELPLEKAVLLDAALAVLKESAPIALPGRMSSGALLQLLERVPAGLRNWTWETKPRTPTSEARKWHIDHEYHVQNMLWALLSPIFPDLDDEQYLTKIGQKNPRADLYIPSMKIMVEAKFIRKGKSFQAIVDEISSDASLYSAMGNEFSGLIAFVWDDSGRTQEHDYLKNGLRKLQGVMGTVVVSRPADWT